MKKNVNFLQELLEEARGLKGMFAEVACKSRLLARQIAESGFDLDVDKSIIQMRNDLYKYSDRIDKIFVELKSYGIASKLE
jgi:hypothetical protein